MKMFKMMQLQDICLAEKGSIISGPFGSNISSKFFVDEGIPVIRGNNLKLGMTRFIDEGFVFVTDEKAKQLHTYAHINDIIFTAAGTIGQVGIIPSDAKYSEYVISNKQLRATIDETKAIPLYVFYWLSQPSMEQYIMNLNTGSTIPLINLSIIKTLPIPVPSLEVQNKIVSILDTIDTKIKNNDKINKNLEQQAQTLFAEYYYLQDCDPIPKGWSPVTLGDVVYISKETFNPSKQPETMLEHYSIPAFDETRYPVFELSTGIKSNKFIVDSDCFMISKLNPTIKRVWRPYCVTDKAVCSTEFIVYKAKDRKLTDFLYSLIDSAPFSDFMCSHVTGSTGSRQRTTPSDTLQYGFYLPTIDEITEFSAVVAPMYAQIRINALENERLKNLRDSLLPRLMSGEIDVSDIGL